MLWKKLLGMTPPLIFDDARRWPRWLDPLIYLQQTKGAEVLSIAHWVNEGIGASRLDFKLDHHRATSRNLRHLDIFRRWRGQGTFGVHPVERLLEELKRVDKVWSYVGEENPNGFPRLGFEGILDQR